MNVAIPGGDVAASQRAQRDVVISRCDIDSCSGTQCNIQLAGSIHAR
jgi:hypothetical protein